MKIILTIDEGQPKHHRAVTSTIGWPEYQAARGKGRMLATYVRMLHEALTCKPLPCFATCKPLRARFTTKKPRTQKGPRK
jgi:hypothetical protein